MQLELTPKITDWLNLLCSTFTHLYTVASGDVDIAHMVYVTQVDPPGWPGFAICSCTFVKVWVMVAIDSVACDIRPVYWRLPGVLSEGQVLYKIQSNFYITESFPPQYSWHPIARPWGQVRIFVSLTYGLYHSFVIVTSSAIMCCSRPCFRTQIQIQIQISSLIPAGERGRLHQGWVGVTKPISPVPLFLSLSKSTLAIEYHVYISQVSPQLGCGGTCQIWKWLKNLTSTFARSDILLTEKLTNGTLVTPTLILGKGTRPFCKQIPHTVNALLLIPLTLKVHNIRQKTIFN